MRILFDISCLDNKGLSGPATYARHLTEALRRYQPVDLVGSWHLSRMNRLDQIRRQWPGELRPYFPLVSDWSSWGFDLFHGPDYRLDNVRATARVVTVHDFSFYEEGYCSPKEARARRRLVESWAKGRQPDAIIAVSEFTRSEILKHFPYLEKKVHVIWHGADHLLVPSNRGPRPIAEPYFLFVGTLENRKNVKGLVEAFGLVKQKPEHRPTRLVLVGKSGFRFDEIKEACRKSPAREHILLPGFISNIGLVNYYQWAEAFVYPSHYEGFGFPVLEAMRLSCPVVTSRSSATAEIAEGAALFIDPKDPQSIAEGMGRITSDDTLRTRLIEKALERGRTFTWQSCAEKTNQVYRQAIRTRQG